MADGQCLSLWKALWKKEAFIKYSTSTGSNALKTFTSDMYREKDCFYSAVLPLRQTCRASWIHIFSITFLATFLSRKDCPCTGCSWFYLFDWLHSLLLRLDFMTIIMGILFLSPLMLIGAMVSHFGFIAVTVEVESSFQIDLQISIACA